MGSQKVHIYQKVPKMGSIIGHRVDYNGVGALHILQKFTQVLPPPRTTRAEVKEYKWPTESTLTVTLIIIKSKKEKTSRTSLYYESDPNIVYNNNNNDIF